MKIIRSMTSRLTITVFLLVLQVAIITYLASLGLTHFPFIAYIGIAVSVLAFSFIIKSNEESAYKMSWVIVVLLFPVFGGALYLLFGNKHSTGKVAKHAKEHALIAKHLDDDGKLSFINKIACGRMYSLFEYVRNASSYHAYKNTQAKYFYRGELMFHDMLAALENAEKFIFVEYFIIKESEMWNKLLEVMERKANEGVDVRLIVDDVGSYRLFSRSYVTKLRSKGIKVLIFNPMIPLFLIFMNNRDHRKITVVDGHTAFTGGINIADEYINKKNRYGTWKDTGVKLQGDAVWSFTLMFIEMWDTFCKKHERINDYLAYKHASSEITPTDGFVLPYGDTPLGNDRLGENVYLDMLNQADRYVYIFTPYLIITDKMIHTLQLAAKRGVDVRIITPSISDIGFVHRLARSYYRCLIEAGVKIYEYTPGFLHAKSFISDDKVAIVGTINLDYRSLYLHFECATLLYQSSVIHEIKNDFLHTIGESEEIKLDNRKRRIWHELIDAVLHLFAPLM